MHHKSLERNRVNKMAARGRLEGKVALITGASRGLGRCIAVSFAEHGAAIGINYLRAEDAAREVLAEVEGNASKGCLVRADIRDEGEVRGMVESVLEQFGRIDILVNNAGLLNTVPLHEMEVSAWDDMMATHLRGMFLCTRFVLPHMLEQGSGKIINMSGSFGVQGGPNFTHLSAAKAGMIGFTRALAREVGPKGIHVNAIAPSMTKTELLANVPKEKLDALIEAYPLRRLGEPEDINATALFLASSDSDYFTGQTLCPAGGDVMV